MSSLVLTEEDLGELRAWAPALLLPAWLTARRPLLLGPAPATLGDPGGSQPSVPASSKAGHRLAPVPELLVAAAPGAPVP